MHAILEESVKYETLSTLSHAFIPQFNFQ